MRRILLLLLVFTLAVRAEDWKTTDGTVYEKVKVLSHDDTFVTIMYADGGARVPLRLLPPDLQARFGYDAKKASAAEAAVAAKDAQDRAALQLRERQQAAAAAIPAAPGVVPAPGVPVKVAARPAFNAGLLQNGDFSQGNRYWLGDGITPIAYARLMHRTTVDPRLTQGLLVPLNPRSWTRLYQQFQEDKGTIYSIAVTYQIGAGTTLSKDPQDYKDISKQVGVEGFELFSSMNVPVGSFYGTIGDPELHRIAMEVYTPDLNSTDVQPYEHTYPEIPAGGNKTFALLFPPGTGVVNVLTVRVTSR